MRLLALVAIAIVSGILLRAYLRLRALRRVVAELERDQFAEPGGLVPVLTLRATLLETALVLQGRVIPVSVARVREGELVVTDWGLTLREREVPILRIPHERVAEALIVRAPEGTLLRVDWRRGGQKLRTTLRAESGIRGAELIRREIHLRAARSVPMPRP